MNGPFRCLAILASVTTAGIYAAGAEPAVTALAFSPDGNSLVCGSTNGLIDRDADDLTKIEGRIETTLEQIHDVRFFVGVDGVHLAAVGGTPAEVGVAEILRWPSGERIHRLELGEDVIYAADWTGDGGLVVAGFDGTLRHIADGQAVRTLNVHSRGVTGVCALPPTKAEASSLLVVSCSIDQTLRLSQLLTGESVRTLHNHSAAVNAVSLQPMQGGLPVVASIGNDKTVRFWQPTIGRMIRFARLPAIPLNLTWTHDGRLITGCDDGEIRVVDQQTLRIVQSVTVGESPVTALTVRPNASMIAAGCHDGTLRMITIEGVE